MLWLTVCDGKYRYIFNDKTGKLEVHRHGEPWRDTTGDGFILALAQDIESTQEENEKLREQMATMAAS